MKKLLTLIIGLAVLATLGGLTTLKAEAKIKSTKSNGSLRAGDDKATPTPTPAKTTTINSTKSNTFRAAVDKASPTPTPKANVRVLNRKQEVLYRDKASPTPKANTTKKIKSTTSNTSLRAGGDKATPTPTPTSKPKSN